MFTKTFHDSFEIAPHVADGKSADQLLGSLSSKDRLSSGITTLLAGGDICAKSPMSYHFKGLPCFLLLYTKDGRGKISDASGTTFLNAGTILFYDCQKPFKINISTSVWHFYAFFITGENVQSFYSYAEREKIGRLNTLSKASDIPSCMEKLCSLSDLASLSRCLCAHKWITDILTELHVTLLNQNETEELIPDYLRNMKKMLDETYAQSLSLADLEEHFGISRYRLCREFSRCYHISPMQYLNKRRIEASKELLLSTDMPVHEIGSTVGIDNTNHFINLFKKNTGTTPFAFKQAAPASIRALHSPYTPGVPPQ